MLLTYGKARGGPWPCTSKHCRFSAKTDWKRNKEKYPKNPRDLGVLQPDVVKRHFTGGKILEVFCDARFEKNTEIRLSELLTKSVPSAFFQRKKFSGTQNAGPQPRVRS